eukprot:4254732-Amphidinium_carterae.1
MVHNGIGKHLNAHTSRGSAGDGGRGQLTPSFTAASMCSQEAGSPIVKQGMQDYHVVASSAQQGGRSSF